MDSRVVMITGAGRGIGRATAVALDQESSRLALLARTASDLQGTAKLLRNAMCLSLPADVADAEQATACVGAVVKEFGRLDAIVHCAGVAPVESILEMSPAGWRSVIETNLSSAFYLAHAAWPTFAKQNSGVIVLLSSEASRDPFRGFAAYAAAKAGLNLFALSAAREGQRIGVTVHAIAPGAVETGMLRQIVTSEQYPPEKTLTPDDVAQVIVRCVGGELRHTSGEVIHLHRWIE